MTREIVTFSSYIENYIEESGYIELLNKREYEAFFMESWKTKFKIALVKKLHEISKYAFMEYWSLNMGEGMDSEEFERNCKDVSFQRHFDEKYPVIKILFNKKMKYEFDGLMIVVNNLIRNYNQILESFNVDKSIRVAEIDTGMGDSHKGKVVAKIIFSDGTRLMYKNRETVGEKVIMGLSSILNIEFAIPRTIKFSDFYIQEYIEPTTFNDENCVREYYKKFGKMVAIFAALGTTDLHSENVIATQSGPKFIDLETIATVAPDNICYNGSAIRATSLFTGCMDKKVYMGIDLSGFSGGQCENEYATVEIVRENDKVFRGDIKIKLPKSSNIPIMKDGKTVNPHDYGNEVLQGYEEGYKEILSHKDEFVRMVMDNLRGTVRKVLRNTAFYGTYLRSSYMPVYLTSYEKWLNFFDLLSEHSKLDISVIRQEKEELRELLIPLFEMSLENGTEGNDRRQMYSKRLEGLDARFFQREKNVLLLIFELDKEEKLSKTNAFSVSVDNQSRVEYEIQRFWEYAYRGKFLSYVTIDKALAPKNLLGYANDIFTFGGSLITLAMYDRLNGQERYKECILDTVQGNYRTEECESGLTGKVAERCLIVILYGIYSDKRFLGILEEKNMSAKKKTTPILKEYDFSGVGSSILAKIVENRLLHNSLDVAKLSETIANYKENSIKRQPTTGLFHGYSGDILLMSVLNIIGQCDDLKGAMELLQMENQYYLECIDNWNDIRGNGIHDMVAISYGAPGILLARIFMLHSALKVLTQEECERITTDIKRGVNKILATERDKFFDDTLINGYGGGLLSLLIAMHWLDHIFTQEEKVSIARYLTKGREELETGEWRCQGIEEGYLPNFMNGNMGIVALMLLMDNYEKIQRIVKEM